MSGNRFHLPAKGHPCLRLTTRSGRVSVTAEDRSDILVEAGGPSMDQVETDATGQVTFTSARNGSASLEVRCPVGTDVVVGTASGSVEVRGDLGQVRVTTISGSIRVGRAETLDIRTVSGSIEVDRCAGRCRVQTKSGRVEVGHAGHAEASTMSGRVEVTNAIGGVRVRTASGQVEIGAEGQGDVCVQTLSGSVRVRLPEGVRPAARLASKTGRLICDCLQGNDCVVDVSSLTGRIEVAPC